MKIKRATRINWSELNSSDLWCFLLTWLSFSLQVVLADKHDTSGQFQNRVDLSRLEVSFLCNNSRVFVSHFHSEGSVPAQIPEPLQAWRGTQRRHKGRVNARSAETLEPDNFGWGWNPFVVRFCSSKASNFRIWSSSQRHSARRGEGECFAIGDEDKGEITSPTDSWTSCTRYLITVSAQLITKNLSLLLLPPLTFVT